MFLEKEKKLAWFTSFGIVTCPIVAKIFPLYLNLFPLVILLLLYFKIAPLRLRFAEVLALSMFIVLAFISMFTNLYRYDLLIPPFLTILSSMVAILLISKLAPREDVFISKLAEYTIWLSCLISFAFLVFEMFGLRLHRSSLWWQVTRSFQGHRDFLTNQSTLQLP